MNGFGAEWCGDIFILCNTTLNMALLLHKTALSPKLWSQTVQSRLQENEFTTILTLIQGKSEYTIASIEQSETPENCDKIYGHILWATSPNSDKSKILFLEYNPSNMLLKVKFTLVPGYLTKLRIHLLILIILC